MPDFVARIRDAVALTPGVSWIHTGATIIEDLGRPVLPMVDRVKRWKTPPIRERRIMAGEELAVSLLNGNWMYFPSCTFRRDVLQAKGFRAGYQIVLDLDLCLRILLDGGACVLLERPGIEYRRHASSLSSAGADDGSRFDEEIAFFELMNAAMADAGWHAAAAAARRHWMSRFHAVAKIPALLTAGKHRAAASMVRVAFAHSTARAWSARHWPTRRCSRCHRCRQVMIARDDATLTRNASHDVAAPQRRDAADERGPSRPKAVAPVDPARAKRGMVDGVRSVRSVRAGSAGEGRRTDRLIEAGCALLCAVLFTLWSRSIDVDPLDRIGQVSGLASLQFRFAVVCILIICALIVVHRRASRRTRALAQRIACASVAGLATGLVAGGIVVALNGTPWGLYVNFGDADALARWSEAVVAGQPIPANYPPVAVYLLAALQSALNEPSGFALQHLQVFGTALIGPVAYLCWRLILPPLWALGIGVLSVLPLVDPYKPYPLLVLVVFVPLWVKFLSVLRSSTKLTLRQAVASGLGFGVLARAAVPHLLRMVRLERRGCSCGADHRHPVANGLSTGGGTRRRQPPCVRCSHVGPHQRAARAGKQRPGLVFLLRHRNRARLHRHVAGRHARDRSL